MAEDGFKIDSKIKAAAQRFKDRLAQLERSAVSDAAQIKREFLNAFRDDDKRRADEIVALSSKVASLIHEFNNRADSMALAVGSMLFVKDALADMAAARAALEGILVASKVEAEVETVSHWVNELLAERDPGPPPQITSLRKIQDTERALDAITSHVYGAGERVAGNIEMMADIIDLRIAYLHEFKLTNLKLSPPEIIERIKSRLEQQPGSVVRCAALQMLKGTLLAVIGPIIEKQLPWGTITDIAKRLEDTFVGKRLDLHPGSGDALFNMNRELMAQEAALETLFMDCEKLKEKMNDLSSAMADIPPKGVEMQ